MIPKIIHQTYKEVENLPPVYKKCQLKVKQLHKDWEYRFWTDNDMYTEIKESFPELYSVFMKLPRKILQIDIFRYCLMWKYGGLYCDLDYLFRKPFDLNANKLVLPISRSLNSSGQLRFGNSIFASIPHHPFWKLLIDDIINNPQHLNANTDSDVMDSEFGTGPGFVTHMYYTCSDEIRDTITTPLKIQFHPPAKSKESELKKNNSYGVHLCESLWTNNRL